MKLIRTEQGYNLNLSLIDSTLLEKIKKDLTIVIKNDNFNITHEIYNYRIHNNNIILPIYYVNTSKNFDNKTVLLKRYKSINCDFIFKGILKEYQKESYECLKNYIYNNKRGIFCLETGYGKTFLSLKLMSELKKKTLIISASVNQKDLLNQWEESINKFIENPSIGILQGKNINIDKDIILTTIKSISQINYPQDIFKGIGFVIIDECFIGSQKIYTSAGLMEIKEIYNFFLEKIPLKILSYSQKKKDFEMQDLTYGWKKEYYGKYVKINNTIKCSDNHLFLKNNGIWVKAKNLKINDILLSLKGTYLVKDLIFYIEKNTVYDIEVNNNHNFILEEGVVAHNCHHISSKTHSEALFKIGGIKNILAISATPERLDNLDQILIQWVGPVFYRGYKIKKGLQPIVEIHKVNYIKDYKEYRNKKGDISYTEMITNLLNIKERNLYICNIIEKLYKEQRTILCLTDRIENVNTIYDLIKNKIKEKDLGCYIGTKMKKDQKKNNLLKKVIIATTKSFSEGIDKQDLNTLILCCPKKHIEQNLVKNKNGSSSFIQIVGRIMRKDHYDFNPLIVDIFDDFSIYKIQFYSRKKFYEKQNWEIIQYKLNKKKIEYDKDDNNKECSVEIKLNELIL